MSRTPDTIDYNEGMTGPEMRKAFKKLQKEKAGERKGAVGILSLKDLSGHRKTRQKLVLDYGKRGGKVTYTPEDLDKFAKSLDGKKNIFPVRKKG